MVDRPILFSGPMVKALLDGTKAQTRRVLKLGAMLEPMPHVWEAKKIDGVWHFISDNLDCGGRQRCPVRYEIGDRLWVRENWYAAYGADDVKPRDMDPSWKICPAVDWNYADWGIKGRLRPGIHMPRWASRLTLTVTDVRVQRLQEISETDAKAEGVEAYEGTTRSPDGTRRNVQSTGYLLPFTDLWERINGPGSWDANPWVVAVSFTVERRNIDA